MVSTPDGTSYFYISEITQSDTNWNRHTIKVPGNSNLTINNDNGTGLDVTFYFAVGSTYHTTADTWGTVQKHGTSNSTNYFDSTSNDMFITGIQIEATSNGIATDFEHRSYGDELRRCERYFEKHWQNNNSASPGGAGGDGYNTVANGTHNGSNGYYVWRWRTQKRALPTISHGGKFRIFGGSSHSNKTVDEFYSPGLDAGRLRVNHSGSAGQSFILEFDGANSSDGYIQASAEL